LFSVSYGEAETGNALDFLNRMNDEFKMQGLRGISILFASSDSGVSASGSCPNNVFEPDWPGTSPYVTTVGGTRLGFLEMGPEKAWTDSGSGWSNVFPIPAYQKTAVDGYLRSEIEI